MVILQQTYQPMIDLLRMELEDLKNTVSFVQESMESLQKTVNAEG